MCSLAYFYLFKAYTLIILRTLRIPLIGEILVRKRELASGLFHGRFSRAQYQFLGYIIVLSILLVLYLYITASVPFAFKSVGNFCFSMLMLTNADVKYHSKNNRIKVGH